MIYADYNGSAPVCEEVRQYLMARLENQGPYSNPNAIHALAQKCNGAMEKARRECAKVLGAKPGQLVFNSGATEGLSHVFYHLLTDGVKDQKNLIIISGIEHSAVVNLACHYADKGFEKVILQTLPNGQVDHKHLDSILAERANQVAMVCVMAANNETGVIQPYKEMSASCQKHHVPFVCDTTQYIGKTAFSFAESGADFAFMSGHKIGAMPGTGILLVKDPTDLKPLVIGGGQERGRRGGTQNYIGNETLAVALDAFAKNYEKLEQLRARRDAFEARIKEKFPKLVVLGGDAPRLASTSFISLPGVHGQAVQIELESQGIYVTTSSACSDNEPVTSKVLRAMAVSDDIGRGAVRISLGMCSDAQWYDQVGDALIKAYEKLSKIRAY
tara:strand:+ start:1562 stop:2722 length:1161 start_codon:yes stop_codon:yes gene_type:complete